MSLCVYVFHVYIYTHTHTSPRWVCQRFFKIIFGTLIFPSRVLHYINTQMETQTCQEHIPASNSEILLCILYQPSFLSFLLKQLANSCSISWQSRNRTETLLNLELSFKLQTFNGVKRNCRFCALPKMRCSTCRAQFLSYHHHSPDVHLSPQ